MPSSYFLRTVLSNIFYWGVGLGLIQPLHSMAQSLRPEIQKPLFEAQEAAAANDGARALALINNVLSLPNLTSAEKNTALRSSIATSVKFAQWPLAIEGLKQILSTGELNEKEQIPLIEALIFSAQKINNLELIQEWSKKYVALSGPKMEVNSLLIQTLSLKEEHPQVIAYLQSWGIENDSAKRKPSEAELRALARAYKVLKDNGGYYRSLKLLLKHYPSENYWADALYQLMSTPGFNQRLSLETYRLLEVTGNLKTTDDYFEMISLAMNAGLPSEAKRLIDIWHKNNSQSMGNHARQYESLNTEIARKLKEDEEELKSAGKAKQDANGWYVIGLIHFSKRDWNLATAAFENSLKAGKISRESERQIRHGLSLAMDKRLNEAFALWSMPIEDETAKEITLLWRLFLNRN